MADYVRTEVVTKRIRYEVPSPTNGAELDKAVSAAAASFRALKGRAIAYDDDLRVTAEDDLVVVWFEVAS